MVYTDRNTGKEHEVNAKVVFLCAGSIATAQLLWASKTKLHPKGLGNESRVLGRYLMDHPTSINAIGIDSRESVESVNHNLVRPSVVYIPRFKNIIKNEKYKRGFSYIGWLGGVEQAYNQVNITSPLPTHSMSKSSFTLIGYAFNIERTG